VNRSSQRSDRNTSDEIHHPDAEAEFDQAVAYYEARQYGLGLEFADEVLVTVARILDYPKAGYLFQRVRGGVSPSVFPMGSFIRFTKKQYGL
jgi:plasmid stabilization system protein ParE